MSKIVIKGNITGDNHHFGDININTPEYFIAKNKHLNLTETEEKLIRIIFDNTNSDEERRNILNSLTNIKNTGNDLENEKEKSIWIQFIEKLKKAGLRAAAKIVSNFLSKYIAQFMDINHQNSNI